MPAPRNDARTSTAEIEAESQRVSSGAEPANIAPQSKIDFEKAVQDRVPPLITFRELRNSVLVHDFRVYIQGTDVTPWVANALTITYSDRDGPNTANFTLDNAFDRFVLTDENLGLRPIPPGSVASEMRRSLPDQYEGSESKAERVAKQQAESGKPVSELRAGEEATTLGLPQFRLEAPDGPNWRYSELPKYEIFLYKAGITKILTQERRGRAAQEFKTVYEATTFEDTDDKFDLAKDMVETTLSRITAGRADRYSLVNSAGVLTSAGKAVQAQLIDSVANSALGLSRADARVVVNECLQDLRNADTQAEIAARDAGIGNANTSEILKFRNRQLQQRRRNAQLVSQLDPETGAINKVEINRNIKDSDTNDAVWPLAPRTCVIHKNDPIRIFIKNPHTEDDEWLYAFTGFVDQATITTDYTNGSSTLNINCYDIRSLMQKMRVSFSIHDAKIIQREPLFEDRSSYFSDLLIPSRLGHAFYQSSLEETVTTLITGKANFKAEESQEISVSGVGRFKLGNTVQWPEPTNQDPTALVNRKKLELWHSQGFTNKPDGSFLSYSEVATVGTGTTTDGEYAPDVANLHMLIPPAGTGVNTLVTGSFQQGTDQRDWTDRYSVIAEFLSNLDYQWLVLPTGDISIEFPMYDFLPEDFGGYEPILTSDLQLIDGGFTDEQGDIVTALVATGSPLSTQIEAQAKSGTQGMIEQTFGNKVLVQSSSLAARVGMRVDTVALPFITDPELLTARAVVEFQKRLADVAQMDMKFGYRPVMLPNRPVFNAHERRMGIASSITQAITIHGTAETGSALKYIRTMRPDGTFRHVTGGDSMPLPYRRVSNNADLDAFLLAYDVNTHSSGVRVASPTDRSALQDQDQEYQDQESDTEDDTPAAPAVKPSVSSDAGVGPQVITGKKSIDSNERFLFRLTSYWMALEDDWNPDPSGVTIPLFDSAGNVIKEVSPSFFCALALEGSGFLTDGRIVGVTGRKNRVSVDPDEWQRKIEALKNVSRRGLCVPAKNPGSVRGLSVQYSGTRARSVRVQTFSVKKPGNGWGRGGRGPLEPFKTVAADYGGVKKSEKSVVLVPPNTRVYIPAFKGFKIPGTGETHDGYFTVTDAGGAIFGAHFDIFTGFKKWRNLVSRPHLVTVEYPEIEGRFEQAEAAVGANPAKRSYYGYGIKKDTSYKVRKGR